MVRAQNINAVIVHTAVLIVALFGIQAAAQNASPSYYRDIAPILETHCVTCHRPGQVAPMTLMTYAQVRPWSKAIAQQVTARTMPPFHAEGPFGRYRDDLRLTDNQIATITSWSTQGAPRGNPDDFAPTRTWSDKPWPAGEPDLVVRFPAVTLEADGTEPYLYLFSDYTGSEDFWLRGYDWHFTNTRRIHHAAAMQLPPGVRPPPEKRADGLTTAFPKVVFGSAGALYLPGLGAHFFPEGSMVKLQSNANVYGLFHYAPTYEEGESDQAELGFYFAHGDALRHFHRLLLQTTDIQIPPGEPHYVQTHRVPFEEDGYVWDFNVHMHARGKSAAINFHYPDGRNEQVFHMPRFSFDWQRRYYLNEPILAPKGTVAEFTLTWDNSADNPLNPDPTSEVTFGPFSYDEMGGARITYVPVDPALGTHAINHGRPVRSGLRKLVDSVEGMSWEELQTFIQSLEVDRRANIQSIWERAHGTAPEE